MFLLNLVLALLVKAASWIDHLDEFLGWTFEGCFAYRGSKRKTVRLEGPTILEARECPATDLWVGPAGGLWSAGANWSSGGAARVPQTGDNLQFGGSVGGVNGALTNSVDDITNLNVGNLTINLANDPNVFAQTITLNPTKNLIVAGNVNIANNTPAGATITGMASLTVNGQNSSFNFGGGTITVQTTFGVQGGTNTMTINGSDVAIKGRFTNLGTINWSSSNPQSGAGPNIDLSNSGQLSNMGTFNINTSNVEKITGQAGSQITNTGVIQKTGVNQTEIQSLFTNNATGSLTVNSGTLAFDDIVANSGSMVLNGGNISSQQSINVEQGGNLAGVGTITVTGAMSKVDNDGTITPGVNGVPGTLRIVGNYTQGMTGTLAINIDTQGHYGVLNISGTATLAGTLFVNNAGYAPPLGSPDLLFMFYGTLANDFNSFNFTNNTWPGEGEHTNSFAAEQKPATKSYDLVVVENF